MPKHIEISEKHIEYGEKHILYTLKGAILRRKLRISLKSAVSTWNTYEIRRELIKLFFGRSVFLNPCRELSPTMTQIVSIKSFYSRKTSPDLAHICHPVKKVQYEPFHPFLRMLYCTHAEPTSDKTHYVNFTVLYKIHYGSYGSL